jgi:glycogen debranching enzyme
MLNRLFAATAIVALVIVSLTGCGNPSSNKPITVDELAIEVKGTSREVAYTNKQAGFFYTETNAAHRNSWQGWNVMAKEILEDYEIIDGEQVLRKSDVTKATVYPHQLARTYPSGTQETLTLLDSMDAFVVQIQNLKGSSLKVRPLFKDSDRREDFVVKFQDSVLLIAHQSHLKRAAGENYPVWVGISLGRNIPSTLLISESNSEGLNFSPAGLSCPQSPNNITIVFAAGDTEDETIALAQSVSRNCDMYIAHRRQRMEQLLNQSFLRTDNQRFDKAFHWALVSMDALVMNQLKKGIFAGLPWFDNYWGRDSFIALPGATLVTGNFSEAKEILRSFADWQEKNLKNPNYGRIPNLVTTGSIAYNTTDGTPRFVIAIHEYFRYSGDTAFVRDMYPVVKRSIEGALAYHVDEHGFLKHGDAETWMDAVGPAGPWSPRGDRANDIQALWFHQLQSSAALAKLSNDQQSFLLWQKIATAVRANFNKLFLSPSDTSLADHLNADGSQDKQVRPNALFALDMIDNDATKAQLFKALTEQLVYAHGVASLSQNDPAFHPYHHFEPYYVQDAAYHNGIVWTWLAGAWIDAAVFYRLPDLAFKVTDNMVHQILDRGGVGTLSELLDAAPRPGEQDPRLSGTFSQAWSLSEFLRVVHQDYLGIHVDAPSNRLSLSPRFPATLHAARAQAIIGHAHVIISYEVANDRVETILESPNSTDSLGVSLDAVVGGVEQQISASLPPQRTMKLVLSRKETTCSIDGVNRSLNPVTKHEPKIKLEGVTLATPTIRPDLQSLKGPSHRLLSNAEAKAPSTSASVLYDVQDPEGDDKGNGNYVYPLTPLLKPGSLDITRFTVSADEKYAFFKLRFRNLSNPGWHPEYGFQLTYVAIAIDKDGKPGSGSTAVGMNSNFFLDPRYAYEAILYVGGGVRVADSKGAILAEYIPVTGDEKNSLGSTQSKEISFSIPLDVLGNPGTSWRYTVLAGCQDDHGGAGIGDFRAVESTAKEWTGGGRKKPSDSNVYDLIFPLIR